ncbi:hypothetical protein PPTS312_00390 [Pseudomonas putida]|uniref:Carbamoyltransferase domain-containing protein n=1 Tax=Pseudomonas putida TaxID=303 RepID=A0A7U6R9U2_PSEPU|nr:hypothetical protein PPTS312_00390 [Pseudomonas putida]
MALTILGLSGALSHDPSAALYIDGKLIAAAEEERFVRDKHAKNRMPYESAKFCLEQAGIKPSDVDVVAIPFAPISLFGKARWHYAKRYWYAPDRALDAILMGNRRYKRYRKKIVWCLEQLGFDPKKVKIEPVEHHLAHASSAYHCSGFKEKPPSSASTVKANTPPPSLATAKTARSTRSRSSSTRTPWVACTARLPSSSASKCSTASSRSWAWRRMAMPASTTSRAWPASKTANW